MAEAFGDHAIEVPEEAQASRVIRRLFDSSLICQGAPFGWRCRLNIILLLIVLLLLFGGGGFYYGGPYVGGGLGTILLVILLVVIFRGL